MRNLRVAAVCVCLLFTVSGLAAQQQIIIDRTTTDMPIPFPGMGPRQPKTGTARLRGRVMMAETGGPVRRAQVRISGQDIGSKTAITDAEISQDEPRYVKGERVKHKLFGDGSIAELTGVGREVKAVIDFDDETVGRKTIKLAYTTLERGQE